MKSVALPDGAFQIEVTHDDASKYIEDFGCDITKEIPEPIITKVTDRLNADIQECVRDVLNKQLYDSHDQSFKDSLEHDGYVGYDGYKKWKSDLREKAKSI